MALAIVMALSRAVAGAELSCPAAAHVTVFVANLSAAPAVEIAIDGEVASASPCAGPGATAYQEVMVCAGTGIVRCGEITGLRPGEWVHRLRVMVPGSAPQEQAQRRVHIGGGPAVASNHLLWTAYPRTFVVGTATAADVQAAIRQAAEYTRCGEGPALVRFSTDAFPGAAAPQRVLLMQRPCGLGPENACRPVGPESGCGLDGAPDGATAGLCFTGSRVVVDALDRSALPGGVILSVDTCGRHVLRLYGSENVLRGLVLEGSAKPDPVAPCQVDTLSITGPAARRNRVEQTVVIGPTCGDAIGVDHGAGGPDGNGAGDNVLVDSRVTGAGDRGLKVAYGASATIARSCVHDNRNGGILSTLAGRVVASENVVQHNVPGASQNGIAVLGRENPSSLVTDANIVRFSGGRGISVADNAVASVRNDYVADNQFAGSTVETSPAGLPGVAPVASFRGTALVCNRYAGLTGTCDPSLGGDETPCATPDDCCAAADGTVDPVCRASTQCRAGSSPRGFGAVVQRAPERAAPVVDFGDPGDTGDNAFTANAGAPEGANLRVTAGEGVLSARGNQWERCPVGSPCDLAADIVAPGVTVDVGVVADPRETQAFTLARLSPGRPRAGDIVRVFGGGFDAVHGNPDSGAGTGPCATQVACSPDGDCPNGPCVGGRCPCAIENPAVRQRNIATGANRIRIRSLGGEVLADASGLTTFYPDAVTPAMLAFRMPFDCIAPLVLEVAKRDPAGRRITASIPLCDPPGCAGETSPVPCDDGNVCTVDDRCSADVCIGTPRSCTGPCATGACDPVSGCVVEARGESCRPAAGPCDVGEVCDGSSTSCPPDALEPDTAVCHASSSPCDPVVRCSGTAPTCPSPATGRTGAEAVTCAFERPLDAAACAGQTVPTRARRLFERAGAVVRRAAASGVRARRARLRRARRLLGEALQAVAAARRRPGHAIGAECATELRAVLRDALQRIAPAAA